jgi:hypothetical protein
MFNITRFRIIEEFGHGSQSIDIEITIRISFLKDGKLKNACSVVQANNRNHAVLKCGEFILNSINPGLSKEVEVTTNRDDHMRLFVCSEPVFDFSFEKVRIQDIVDELSKIEIYVNRLKCLELLEA